MHTGKQRGSNRRSGSRSEKESSREIESLARFPSENPNPVLRIDANGTLLYANAASTALLKEWILSVEPPAPKILREKSFEAICNRRCVEIDIRHDTSVFSFSIAPIAEAGYANIYGRDITDRVRTEQENQRALRERETLLRELYHRTKNNMTVISSMLSLYAAQSKDEKFLQISQEIENKISSMALVHQKLYESGNLSNIELDAYIRELIQLLFDSYGSSARHISVIYDLAPVWVPLDHAIPCGLIINELFTNALKHAFPDHREGRITLRLIRDPKSQTIEFMYRDDGGGVHPEFDFRAQPTLGLQTIFMLVEHQLQGRIVFEAKDGIRCMIVFKHSTAPSFEVS